MVLGACRPPGDWKLSGGGPSSVQIGDERQPDSRGFNGPKAVWRAVYSGSITAASAAITGNTSPGRRRPMAQCRGC